MGATQGVRRADAILIPRPLGEVAAKPTEWAVEHTVVQD